MSTTLQTLKQALLQRRGEIDFWLSLCILILTSAAMSPIIHWVLAGTFQQERLLHALAVLGLTGFALLYKRAEVPRFSFELGRPAIKALCAAYVLVALALFTNWSVLLLGALSCVIAALLYFILNPTSHRSILALCTAFGGFLIFSFMMEPLDWPLRALAGHFSQSLFDLFGRETQLGLLAGSSEPRLLLMVKEQIFEVAPECNGFGIMVSSLLVTLLVTVYDRRNFAHIGFYLFAALLLGFFANLVRIGIIVTLAPHMMPHYDLMHEIVGGFTYWGTLILLWLALTRKGQVTRQNQAKSNS